MFASSDFSFSASLKSAIASGNCFWVVYSIPRCCRAATRFGACLRSSCAALRNASTALSQSLLSVASNPSFEYLAASFASLLACAWTNCEAQSARAIIRVRAEYFFMIFLLDVGLSGEFETQAIDSWLQIQLFRCVPEKAPAPCQSLARARVRTQLVRPRPLA